MSTLLSLVQDVGRDTGTLPNWATLSTLTGASERAQKIAAWVKEAWLNLQNERQDWLWMRAEFTSALVIDQLRYTGVTSFGLTRFGEFAADTSDILPFSIYDNAIGVADEGEIAQISYEEWFDKYARGSHDHNRPTEWAISPAGEFVVGTKPDKAYVIRGMYVKSPQTLSADGDIPELPVRFHGIIKTEAVRLLQVADGGYDEYKIASVELAQMKSDLARQQLPEISLGGGPLA